MGIVDIETTGLKGDYAQILGAVVKEYNGEMRVFRCDDYPIFKTQPWNDRQLCIDLRDELERYDEISGWNSFFFDKNTINTRLILNGDRPMRNIKHRDLMMISKKNLTIHNGRLDSIARALGLEDEKTVLDPVNWMRVTRGGNTPEGKASLDYIMEHCVIDVLITEQVWSILSPLVNKVW